MSKQAYSKAKGRESERAIVDYLRLRGFPAERRRLSGSQDMGDVAAVEGWVIESKAEKRINLPGYLDELRAEVANADKRLGGRHRGLVVVKRRGTQMPGDWYAVLPFSDMVEILLALKGRGLTVDKAPATVIPSLEDKP